MHSQVQKWGNSLGIRIPKTIAQKLHLHSGSQVELDMINQRIVITKSNLELEQVKEPEPLKEVELSKEPELVKEVKESKKSIWHYLNPLSWKFSKNKK